MGIPSEAELNDMSDEDLAELVSRVHGVYQGRASDELARLVREELQANDDVRTQGSEPLAVVFGPTEYDNGWFYDENSATVRFADGEEWDDYSFGDRGIDEALATLSDGGSVGETATLTLDLRTGDVEHDEYGRN